MKSLLERPDDQAGHEGHSHEHGGIFGMNTELIFALICGALLGAGALAGKLGLIDRLPLILYVSARGGVLIKGGAPLEELGSLNAMAFDKTGTLTEGRPRITDVIPIGGTQIEDLLNVAIAVESMSDHPLAAAIVRDGEEMIGTRRRFQAKNMSNMIGET